MLDLEKAETNPLLDIVERCPERSAKDREENGPERYPTFFPSCNVRKARTRFKLTNRVIAQLNQ